MEHPPRHSGLLPGGDGAVGAGGVNMAEKNLCALALAKKAEQAI